jgi:hypothetical protein
MYKFLEIALLVTFFAAMTFLIYDTGTIIGTYRVVYHCEEYGSYKTDNFEMTCEVTK